MKFSGVLLVLAVFLVSSASAATPSATCGCNATPPWFTPWWDGRYDRIIKACNPSCDPSDTCSILTGGGSKVNVNCAKLSEAISADPNVYSDTTDPVVCSEIME